jgi:hypothetical protein
VLDVVAAQAAEGQVDRVLISFGQGAVRDLRQLLRQSEGGIHPKTYAEASRFLDRAERGLTRLKTADAGPAIKTSDTGPGGARPK